VEATTCKRCGKAITPENDPVILGLCVDCDEREEKLRAGLTKDIEDDARWRATRHQHPNDPQN
jgi:NMD protein affecting ribosome stability and mRNA decay